MRGAITPLLEYVFMAWCLVKHRDKTIYSLRCHLHVVSISTLELMYAVSKYGIPKINHMSEKSQCR
jgi:hypothetical protein